MRCVKENRKKRKRLRFLRFSFTQRTQRKLRWNGNRARGTNISATLVCTPLVTFRGTLVANEVTENLLGTIECSLVATVLRAPPSYVRVTNV